MFNPKYVLTGFRNYQIPFQDKNVLDQQLTLPAFTCSQLVPTLLTILSLPTSQFRQSVKGEKIKSGPTTNHKCARAEIQIKLSDEKKGRLAAIYRETANQSNCHKTGGRPKKGGAQFPD